MSDDREVFTIVENDSSGVGEKLPARQEGDTITAKNGIVVLPCKTAAGAAVLETAVAEGDTPPTLAKTGYAFKDSSGNAVLPQLTAAGKLPVETADVGDCISDQAQSVAGGLTFQDVITLVLALTKNYKDLEFSGSCLHTTLWEIVHIDDVGGTPTETKVHTFMTGPGQFTVSENFDCGDFTTIGGTGTQNLVLRGKNVRHASDLHGYLGTLEGI